MPALLVVASLLFCVLGLVEVNRATWGVGALAIACLFAIFARIEQASRQHKALLEALKERREP